MPKCLLIKNTDLYDPDHLGKRDLLLVNGRVVLVEEEIAAGRPDPTAARRRSS